MQRANLVVCFTGPWTSSRSLQPAAALCVVPFSPFNTTDRWLRGGRAVPHHGGVPTKPTRAVRVIVAIDERHKLHADVPPGLSPGAVHLFVLPAESGLDDGE